jgi:AraC-like DNA-binding protein
VFAAELPDDTVIMDRLLAETAFVRILLRGDWAAQISPDTWGNTGSTLLFGANARPFPVRVSGPFTVAGFGIKPSGWRALFTEPATTYTDKMVPLAEAWGDLATDMETALASATDDAQIVEAMEICIRAQLAKVGRPKEDMLISRLESTARMDSTIKIETVAETLGLSVRQIERRCLKSFGMSPKLVFQRSRFLDMAAAMRGLTNPSETRLAGLRFFDQSHLNREFRAFTGMTPGQFRRSETPLLTEGLKLRAEGDFLFKPR